MLIHTCFMTDMYLLYNHIYYISTYLYSVKCSFRGVGNSRNFKKVYSLICQKILVMTQTISQVLDIYLTRRISE